MAMVHETVGSRYLAEVLGLLPWEPPVPKRGERFGRAAACWLCGGDTGGVGWPKAVAIAPTFTNHNLAAVPASDAVCQACVATSSGETWKAYVAGHPEHNLKCVHPLSWRTYSHAASGAGVEHPVRSRWRALLLEPPGPPFLFVVCRSGQKQLLFRALVAGDRDLYPVQFEDERLWVERGAFAACLGAVEAALAAGWSREEVGTGRGNPGRRPADLRAWRAAGQDAARWRLGEPGLLRLALHVAASPAKAAKEAA